LFSLITETIVIDDFYHVFLRKGFRDYQEIKNNASIEPKFLMKKNTIEICLIQSSIIQKKYP